MGKFDFSRALELKPRTKLMGFETAAELLEHLSITVSVAGNLWIASLHNLFRDGKRTPQEGICSEKEMALRIERAQIVEVIGRIWMLRPEGLLADFQSP